LEIVQTENRKGGGGGKREKVRTPQEMVRERERGKKKKRVRGRNGKRVREAMDSDPVVVTVHNHRGGKAVWAPVVGN
jgi:hypothetical protein